MEAQRKHDHGKKYGQQRQQNYAWVIFFLQGIVKAYAIAKAMCVLFNNEFSATCMFLLVMGTRPFLENHFASCLAYFHVCRQQLNQLSGAIVTYALCLSPFSRLPVGAIQQMTFALAIPLAIREQKQQFARLDQRCAMISQRLEALFANFFGTTFHTVVFKLVLLWCSDSPFDTICVQC
eukprot:4041485-Amphidinium_carterae.1